MRAIAIIIAILGLAVFVFGILFVAQAGSAEKEIATEIQPVTIAEVNAKYDAVKAKQLALAATEEPLIQTGKAAPSAIYVYLSGQRTSLALAKSNIGVAKFVRTSGTVNILLGLGVFLAGVWLLRKSQSAA